jgi:predicted aconitase
MKEHMHGESSAIYANAILGARTNEGREFGFGNT